LFEAIRAKDPIAVQEIIELGGVDLDPPTQPYQVNKALAYASIYGNLDIVKYILAQGVKVDGVVAYGGTALLRAAEVQHNDIVEFLIESGANVNHPNSFGISAMTGFAIICNTRLLEMAIANGGDINKSYKIQVSKSHGQLAYNPIQWAVVKGNTECVEFLAKNGANLDVLTRDGETLIELAGIKNDERTFEEINKLIK